MISLLELNLYSGIIRVIPPLPHFMFHILFSFRFCMLCCVSCWRKKNTFYRSWFCKFVCVYNVCVAISFFFLEVAFLDRRILFMVSFLLFFFWGGVFSELSVELRLYHNLWGVKTTAKKIERVTRWFVTCHVGCSRLIKWFHY
jgi:hypothetical protein